ncbi:MAG: hypothetical protein ACT4P4_00815 [Betaproteobacteria bacterium]
MAERALRVRGGKPSDERRRDAIVLLEALRECVDLGKPIPEPLRNYLGSALEFILDYGVSAESAFGLVRPKNRGAQDDERDLRITAYVMHQMDKRLAARKAESIAADRACGLSEEAALDKWQKALDKWRECEALKEKYIAVARARGLSKKVGRAEWRKSLDKWQKVEDKKRSRSKTESVAEASVVFRLDTRTIERTVEDHPEIAALLPKEVEALAALSPDEAEMLAGQSGLRP